MYNIYHDISTQFLLIYKLHYSYIGQLAAMDGDS